VTTDPTSVAGAWLEKFGVAAERADAAAAAALFLADGWWRDLLAFTWDLRTFHGGDAIATAFGGTLRSAGASQFRLEPGKAVVLTDGDPASRWIQAFFLFETRVARGRGFLRLKSEAGEWRAWTVLTAMEELKGFEERVGPRRAIGTAHGEHKERINWREERRDACEFVGRDPQVVVVGAGQAGLTIAARLTQLGVSTLIVEKNERVGDNWRSRYRSLVLHDPVWYDHLPYMPFPAHWPVFTPKDKLAGWLESYVDALELNVWTKARLVGGDYDEDAGHWTVRIDRNGGERVLHPRHLVLSTGSSGDRKSGG
jgi:putative flavoprotein involved in K+ transport